MIVYLFLREPQYKYINTNNKVNVIFFIFIKDFHEIFLRR